RRKGACPPPPRARRSRPPPPDPARRSRRPRAPLPRIPASEGAWTRPVPAKGPRVPALAFDPTRDPGPSPGPGSRRFAPSVSGRLTAPPGRSTVDVDGLRREAAIAPGRDPQPSPPMFRWPDRPITVILAYGLVFVGLPILCLLSYL